MDYRREIDGLRAVAVLPVMLFHAGFQAFGGGYVGVDIFFVISGYLITSILLSEIRSESFSITRFYERRARRILPALFFMMACTLPVAWTWLDPFALKEYFQSMASISIFASNVYFYLKTGYFDVSAELKPLLHTWSLGVEEQYYIFFPLLLMLMHRFGWRHAMSVLGVVAVASLAYAQSRLGSDPSAAFYLLTSRAWELLIGSFAAFWLSRGVPRWSPGFETFASSSGVAMLVSSIFLFDHATPFPGLNAVVPCAGTFLIILFARPGTPAHALLSMRALVAVGLVSYSAYLWHQPMLAFFRIITLRQPQAPEALMLIAATMALAWFSYRFVERPFRKAGRGWFDQRRILASAAAGIVAFGAVGMAGHAKQGFPERSPEFVRLLQNKGLSDACSGAALDDARCRTSEQPRVILWGDSFAMHLANALKLASPQEGVWQLTLSACPPVPGYDGAPIKAKITCKDFNDLVLERLMTLEHPEQYRIVLSSMENLAAPAFHDRLSETVARLKARGFKLTLVSPTPLFAETQRCVIGGIRDGRGVSSCTFEQTTAFNREAFDQLGRMAESLSIGYVDLTKLFCADGRCGAERDGVLLYCDFGHMSNESAPLVAAFMHGRLDGVDVRDDVRFVTARGTTQTQN